jgi:uncharacterized protein YdcH (DUF465 family)
MRNRTRQFSEDYPRLDISALKKRNLFEEYTQGRSFGSADKKETWSIGWLIFSDSITVQYDYQGRSYAHSVNLVLDEPTYGGVRHYIECPVCSERRKQVYISEGTIGCRTCLNLHYKSQSESQTERLFRKKDALYNKLDKVEGGYQLRKKKWQRTRTFTKISDEINSLDHHILKNLALSAELYF